MKNFLGISIPLIKIAWKVIKVIFAIFSQKKPTTEERWGRYHTIYRMRSGIYANKITHNFFCALFSIYPSLYLSIHISHSLPIFFSTVFFLLLFRNSAPFYFTELQLLSLPFSFTHSRMWNVSHGFLLAYCSSSNRERGRENKINQNHACYTASEREWEQQNQGKKK